MTTPANFADIVTVESQSLASEYGLVPAGAAAVGLRHEVLFKNSTTGVEFVWEQPDGLILVRIYRLQDGAVPARTIDPANGFYFGSLLELRAPTETLPAGGEAALSGEEIARIVKQYVCLLKAHADDLLRGDFAVFAQLTDVAARRARENGVPDARNPYLRASKTG